MKLLVIGSGGREHALAWKLTQSSRVQTVFVAPGNGGTARAEHMQNVPITDINELIQFAKREKIAFTVVGPEAPLAAGVVDAFRSEGLKIFGPTTSPRRPTKPLPTRCKPKITFRPRALPLW
jgi:phosphoribosylamine--glycine ligase